MPCIRNYVALSLLTIVGLMAGAAHAAPGSEPGWYLGADVGRSELKVEQGPEETAFAIHGGYRLTRHLAIEATYADLGDFGYTVPCPEVCIPELYPQRVDESIKRLDVALLGIVPFGERVEAYARVGAARTDTDTTVSALAGTFSRSSDTSDLVYGVGLRVHLDAPWSLRLQWDRGSADTGVAASDADVDALWLGAEYRFAR